VGAPQGAYVGGRLIPVVNRRLRRISGEVARFSAVNVVATIIALIIFNGLVHGVKGWFSGPLHDHALSSYLLANSVGMFVSYYGARHYAFKHRHAAGPGGGLLIYVVINLSSFVIPISCLWITRNVFEWTSIYADNIAGNVIGAMLGNVFRFWAFRRFVFTKQPAVSRRVHVGVHAAEEPEPELPPVV
jgi:putative flippase GtrA